MNYSASPDEYDWDYDYHFEIYKKYINITPRIQAYIASITDCLYKLPKAELRDYLIDLINSNKDLDKRYAIALAINEIIGDKDIYDQEKQFRIIQQFEDDVFDSESELYKALNIQRSLIFRFTLFGKMHWLSQSAQSLQQAQSIIMKEKNTIEMDTIKLYK